MILEKMDITDFEKIRSTLISEYDDFWSEDTLKNAIKNDNYEVFVAKEDARKYNGVCCYLESGR